jgi:hypothetical protein
MRNFFNVALLRVQLKYEVLLNNQNFTKQVMTIKIVGIVLCSIFFA